MSEELLNNLVEKAKALGLDDDVISSMKLQWVSRLSDLEDELHPQLNAEIMSQILSMGDLAELEEMQKERMRDAIELGMDLSKIAALNEEERRQHDELYWMPRRE